MTGDGDSSYNDDKDDVNNNNISVWLFVRVHKSGYELIKWAYNHNIGVIVSTMWPLFLWKSYCEWIPPIHACVYNDILFVYFVCNFLFLSLLLLLLLLCGVKFSKPWLLWIIHFIIVYTRTHTYYPTSQPTNHPTKQTARQTER